MPAALIDQLYEVGATCQAFAAWTRCEGGRKDMCEKCILGSPEICDAQVIKALVHKLVAATEQTDAALAQRDYWKRTADRLCGTTYSNPEDNPLPPGLLPGPHI